MSKRSLVLLLMLALVISSILLMRTCQDVASPDPAPSETAVPAGQADGGDSAKAAADARARVVAAQRYEAMSAAASTLHRYIAALSGPDRAKADAFWVNKQPPVDSGEADLRTLTDVRELRSQTDAPKPLDGQAVPSALEIPIHLRVALHGKPMQRYRGWYRMRRAVADGGWEITSASITPEPR